jgi:hypothetical protein
MLHHVCLAAQVSRSTPPKTPVHSECLHKSTYWSCLAWAGRPRHAASSAASAPPSPSAAPWARCCKCSASAPPKTPVHSECLHKSTYWSCCPTAQCDMQLLHHCSSLARMGWAASSCSSVCRLGSSLSIDFSLCQVLQVLRQRNRQIGELDVAGLQLVLLEVLGRALA